MTSTIPDILARIVSVKQTELAAIRVRRPELERAAELRSSDRRDFVGALRVNPPAVIAEVKKASPSRGVLSEDFRPVEIAREYEAAGTAAMSVLTDGPFFQGSLADLEAARAAVSIPVLRKDFTIDEVHVVEAAAHGADAILLIAAILSTAEMRRWRELASSYGMASLVEVHTGDELSSAIDSGAEVVGVNSRNLHTFEVSLNTALDLVPRIPAAALKVAESGIHSRADLAVLRSAGYDAFLVGEHLMKSGDARRALMELRS
jgi:indole-3-glycerol phosphate synthase